MFDLLLRKLLNPAAYALRQRIAFRRGGYREGPLDLSRVSPRLREQLQGSRAQELAAKYAVPMHTLSHAAYTKSLFACDVLDRLHTIAPIVLPTGNLLDIGCKNFETAPGLFRAARTLSSHEIDLTGVEIDAYPVYRNLHSRADAAHYYLSLLPGEHRYLPDDVRALQGQFGLITWFFPFVTTAPLLWWGLPERFFAPEALFQHVLTLRQPGGSLIVTNYTPEEAEIQAELFARAGISPQRHVFEDLIGRAGQLVYVFRA